jgi:hypothetical protein
MDGQDRYVIGHAALDVERRIHRPAARDRAAGDEEGGDEQDAGGRQQPEAPVVEAREGHVRGADHQRNLPVGEADQRRHDRPEDHYQAMHRRQLVEYLGLEQLQAGLEQFGADQHRQCAGEEEHEQAEPQVQRTDVLVVGAGQPTRDAGRGVVFVVVGCGIGDRRGVHA